MARVGVCVPSVSDPELLRACCESVRSQDGFDTADGLVVANSTRVLDEASRQAGEGFDVHVPGTNLGTCASWNFAARWAWRRGLEAVLVLNDDVELLDEDVVRKLGQEVGHDPNRLIVLFSLGFSAFVMTRELWEGVGEFDEGFWPAYFEDNDYHLRVVKKGWPGFDVPCRTLHHGSASLRRWKEWEDWNAMFAFPVNARRFVAKWGGPPGHTNFVEPWDGRPERAWATRDELRRMGCPPPPWGW